MEATRKRAGATLARRCGWSKQEKAYRRAHDHRSCAYNGKKSRGTTREGTPHGDEDSNENEREGESQKKGAAKSHGGCIQVCVWLTLEGRESVVREGGKSRKRGEASQPRNKKKEREPGKRALRSKCEGAERQRRRQAQKRAAHAGRGGTRASDPPSGPPRWGFKKMRAEWEVLYEIRDASEVTPFFVFWGDDILCIVARMSLSLCGCMGEQAYPAERMEETHATWSCAYKNEMAWLSFSSSAVV